MRAINRNGGRRAHANSTFDQRANLENQIVDYISMWKDPVPTKDIADTFGYTEKAMRVRLQDLVTEGRLAKPIKHGNTWSIAK